MAEISLAREVFACRRQQWEGVPPSDGSGLRVPKRRTGCGKSAGSMNGRTGALLACGYEDGEHHHITPLPGPADIGTAATVGGAGI